MTAAPGPVAVRVFPGQADQAAEARRWIRALACATDPLATDDALLVLTELFANAIQHTRSGDQGGTVTVAVTADGVIHVHDLGTSAQPACAYLTAAAPADPRLLQEVNGRGLLIVAALCPERQAMPAIQCLAAWPEDPAVRAGGCCISCRPRSWPPRQAQDQPGVADARVS
jgi:serine/threonine-protein kinase RsbW